jgi:hypothetical protein
MKRLIYLFCLVMLAGTMSVFAQEATPEATTAIDMEAWRPYFNNRVGFGLMLPPEWVVRDYGNTLDINTDLDDPASTALKVLLSPVEFIEGGTYQGTPVPDLPLETYASIALGYELGAPGAFTLQTVEPFTTEDGVEGIRADWLLEIIPLQDTEAEATAEPREPIPYHAYYFELDDPVIDGQQMRALEIITSDPPPVDAEIIDAVLASIQIGHLTAEDEPFAGLQEAVSAYLDTNDSTITDALVEPQLMDGDYVRFALSTGEQAAEDKAVGFARRVEDGWEIIMIGTGVAPEFFTENQIPASLELITSG